MTLSRLALLLCSSLLAATAHAQFGSPRPTPTAPKIAVVKQPSGAAQAQPSLQNTIALLVGGSDDCAAPDLITGAGPFSVDTTLATTGAQGQSESACLFFGTPGITNDVWFQWTATGTGPATLSLCGGTAGIDPKVAIYPAGA